MELRVGSAVDRYCIEGVIGEGGMAQVYLVRHRELQSVHALKVLSFHGRKNRERLLQEGRLQSGFRHPNVVPVTDVIEIYHMPALVMDYVPGPDLRMLFQHCKLTDVQVNELVRGILRGVIAAHQHGLVHRDLKPSNILIDLQDEQLIPRIADFGLAKNQFQASEQRLTQTGATLGTPGYMAPEQIRDAHNVDKRADIFSLGAILYEAVTGRMAFDGTHTMEIWTRITDGQYTPINQIRPEVPVGIVDIIHAALEPNPDQRIGDVQTLLDAWESVGGQVITQTGEPSKIWHGATLNGVRDLVIQRKKQIAQSRRDMMVLGSKAAKTIDPDAPFRVRADLGSIAIPTTVPGSGGLSAPRDLPGHLPRQHDRFFGRKEELVALQGHVDQGARLLTLMGPGGMGKTRLSLVFGTENRRHFAGGVWFCDLTETHNQEGVVRAVAQTLGVLLDEGEPVVQLANALRGRGRTLIILDNMEQVVEHAKDTVGHWMLRAPESTFLITSRTRLGLQGEQIFVLGSLTVDEGVALFEDRARRVNPDFRLTPESRVVVQEIVTRLDCMSLAIELASARVQLLSPSQLLERLNQRFRLLRSGRRDQSARQSTLRGAIDWSWDLLEPGEKAGLAQCSIFRGGFSLEAAEAVLALDPWDVWPMDVVQSLVEQSLLWRSEPSPGENRFHMYESIREYAREKMESPDAVVDQQGLIHTGPEACADLALRHGQFYASLGDEKFLETQLWGDASVSSGSFRKESDNLLAAMDFAQRRQKPEILAPATAAWVAIHQWNGSCPGALDVLTQVLERDDLEPRDRLQLMEAQGTLLWHMGRKEDAWAVADVCLAEARAMDDGREVGRQLANKLGFQVWGFAFEEVESQYLEALALVRQSGDRRMETEILIRMAGLGLTQGDHTQTKACLDEAFVLIETLGSARLEVSALRASAHYHMDRGDMVGAEANLLRALSRAKDTERSRLLIFVYTAMGTFYKDQGRLKESVRVHEAGIQLCREMGNRREACVLIGNLALVLQLQGDTNRAREMYEDTMRLAREIGFQAVEAMAVGNLGDLLLEQGLLEESGQHLLQSIGSMDGLDSSTGGAFRGSLAWVRAQEGHFGEARELLKVGEGQLRGVWAVELGRLLCRRAQVEHLAGAEASAHVALDEAKRIAEQMGAGPESDLGQLVAEAEHGFADATDEKESD